ncbi:hypothetical protein DB32_000463 [Sandaracinus amylolyticus]|uniref:Uncharacterized protein n=1 Tax=Sandaracinus amylolyticus TaxID=927083 RepID=A0A0F6SDE7_9BACT|nr:hypothetical protein DB32_000463 [Sandaracinus amylolyticus]
MVLAIIDISRQSTIRLPRDERRRETPPEPDRPIAARAGVRERKRWLHSTPPWRDRNRDAEGRRAR